MPENEAGYTFAGEVTSAQGQVFAEQNGVVRPLAEGDPIFTGDVLVTAANSRMEVRFEDDTVLSQGENSRLTVDEYTYDPNNDDASNMLFQMTEGAFRMVTGKIAEANPDAVRVESPLAVIGIRGTTTVHEIAAAVDNDPGPEKHGAEELTGGQSLLLGDLFGNTQVVTFALGMVDFSFGAPMGAVRTMTAAEIADFQNAAPLTTLGEPEPPEPDDDQPDEDQPEDQPGDEEPGEEQPVEGEEGELEAGDQLEEELGPEEGVLGLDGLLDGEGELPSLEFAEDLFGDDLFFEPLADFGPDEELFELVNLVDEPEPDDDFFADDDDDDDITEPTAAPFVPDNDWDGSNLSGANVTKGTSGNDTIIGTTGDDTIVGLDGDDSLIGTTTQNWIFGGAGSDTLRGDSESDTNGGNDTIYGGEGGDSIFGDEGSDSLIGGAGADHFAFNHPDEGGDIIVDFTHGEDTLGFQSTDFNSGSFGFLVDNTATESNTNGGSAFLVWNEGTDKLFWDDGSGSGTFTLLATFENDPTIDSGDTGVY